MIVRVTLRRPHSVRDGGAWGPQPLWGSRGHYDIRAPMPGRWRGLVVAMDSQPGSSPKPAPSPATNTQDKPSGVPGVGLIMKAILDAARQLTGASSGPPAASTAPPATATMEDSSPVQPVSSVEAAAAPATNTAGQPAFAQQGSSVQPAAAPATPLMNELPSLQHGSSPEPAAAPSTPLVNELASLQQGSLLEPAAAPATSTAEEPALGQQSSLIESAGAPTTPLVHELSSLQQSSSPEPAAAPATGTASQPASMQQGSSLKPAATPAPSTADAPASPPGGLGTAATRLSAPLLRKTLKASCAGEALDVLAEALESADGSAPLTPGECSRLLAAALEAGNLPLAMSIHGEMCAALRSPGPSGSRAASGGSGGGGGSLLRWPAVTLAVTTQLVLDLAKALAVAEALKVLQAMRVQGMPASQEVQFGLVVTCPLSPDKPLTLVQPHEGSVRVADSFSRYQYDVFSGTVVTSKSEALSSGPGLLASAARQLGLLRRPACAAIHEFVVRAPDGQSRTFRCGTATANVPAQEGERVSVVCAVSAAQDGPLQSSNKRRTGPFALAARQPDKLPGEPLSVTNHATRVVAPLVRPPVSAAAGDDWPPKWLFPVLLVTGSGDAASYLLDPTLPALVALGAGVAAGGAYAVNKVLLPRLKQLPATAVKLEAMRQQLLAQHEQLSRKREGVLAEAGEDVRQLARLWQLQNKMTLASVAAPPPAPATAGAPVSASSAGPAAVASVPAPADAAASGVSAYEARMERVAAARENIQERLAKRVELLEGYSRVMNMIEIEVEMDIEVPAAEVAGIEAQIGRLVELEDIAEEWRGQAEARDEVERLLRTAY